jgi:hypothetical protein
VGYGLLNGIRMATAFLFGKSGAHIFAVQDVDVSAVLLAAKRSTAAGSAISDYFARNTDNNRVIRNILGYYRAGSDHAIPADRNARQHAGAGSDARAVSHAYAPGKRGAALTCTPTPKTHS